MKQATTKQDDHDQQPHDINATPELAGYSGTEHYYRTILPRVFFTDGVKALAEKYGAHWLIDIVASYQPELGAAADNKSIPFQIWTLEHTPRVKTTTRAAVVTIKEDTNAPLIIQQDIPYTDFPNNSIVKLYACEGYDDTDENGEPLVSPRRYVTIMLPNEY